MAWKCENKKKRNSFPQSFFRNAKDASEISLGRRERLIKRGYSFSPAAERDGAESQGKKSRKSLRFAFCTHFLAFY